MEQSTLKRSHDEAKVFSVPSNTPKNITGYPIVVSGPARTVEKRDKQDVLDKLPMQGFVLCCPNVSTIHSISTARDVATMTASSMPQSLPMGKVLLSWQTCLLKGQMQ